MDQLGRDAIQLALARIPRSLFIMTAAHDRRARGVMVEWVQQVGCRPAMVMVALKKGRHIVPLIHDSHSFGLCQIAANDRLTQRRFSPEFEPGDDAFQTLDISRGPSGSPILKKSLAYLDCELVRHLDVDTDHDLYIGQIIACQVLNPDAEIIVEYDRPANHDTDTHA